jgi:predicted DCC family thiol-disulfide oxidoreductase YuxK
VTEAIAAGERAPERDRLVVLYDRDCGFCRWSLARLLAFDVRRRLRPVALQTDEAARRLGDMDEARRFASAHLVLPDGRVYSGGDAVAPLLAELPGGGPLSALAGLVPGVWRTGYDAIAARRGIFGRRLSRDAVARATARIDRHVPTGASRRP